MDWFPHDIEAYDTDTLHLTATEDGVYHRLLRWYYKHERALPSDDVSLAAIARIGLAEWGPMSSRIRNFFETRVSRVTNVATLHQKRCNGYILKQNAKRRDGKARQDKFRKNNMLGDDYDVSRVTNAADRNRIGVEETQSLFADSQIKTKTESLERGGEGENAPNGAAPQNDQLSGVDGGPPKPTPKPRKPNPPRTRMAADWVPNERNRTYARDCGLTDSQIDAVAIRYRRYWVGADAKNPAKADWDGTWENWIDRDIGNGALGRGNGRAGSPGDHGPAGRLAGAYAAIRDRDRREEDALHAERPEDGDRPLVTEPAPEPRRARPSALVLEDDQPAAAEG